MATIDECGEECNRCGKILDGTVPYTNIPHTDVYYCDACLGRYIGEENVHDDL